ncbi:hypothetical protein Ahy_Scaffold1g107025 isoform B [Arachis hypogaea]|uniref:Glycosyl hydrolase family 43 protein n=1 Tax=Arachis hypogaea TaxID=3818 RepID=A0A444WU54_ARAHY|nr:hypothetical protein Ahy_Scaffold1g107025 isoform B [Arachis hypogaea]
MRTRSKYRKSTNLCCNSWSRCCTPAVLWSLIGCLLLLHLYSYILHEDRDGRLSQLHVTHHPQFRELQQLEDEDVQIPPPRGKRSPRAAKRRPKRAAGNDSNYYYPGRIWLDTDGNPIQAHGGGILYDKGSRTYYWYGEYKDGPTYHVHKEGPARVDIIGVGCYSSKDLWTWKHEGIVLAAEETDETHDLHKSNVLERPKVIYNEKTGKYVMWMHVDDGNYTKAAVGVAISDTPDGPFDYLGSQRPHGCESRDMTVFKDEDGMAYLIYSSEDNSELHIGPLTEDYLNVTPTMRRILVGQHREAPALFKHRGTYYMITSGCTGWAPNEALAHAADSVLGPWETIGNPCIVGNNMFRLTTFFAQSTFVLPLPGFQGLFIFMADRWNPADLRDSRYVWLPLVVAGPVDQPLEYTFEFPLWSRVSIYWHRKWRLPQGWTGLKLFM